MTKDRNGLQSGSSIRPAPVSELLGVPGLEAPRPKERADAARNRVRILESAERLFTERGVADVTMDDIAAAAQVGKGTLYRRFTDKGGLAGALLNERGRDLQQLILSGRPPLGPGAPAADRLVAFTEAYVRFQARHLDLVLLSENSTPGARVHKGSYAFWRQHCVLLLRAVGAPDAATRAEVLLAALAADQVRHWLQDQDRRLDELSTALASVARALTA